MIVWISFFVIVFIILHLGVLINTHIISTQRSNWWTVIWVTIFSFSGVIYWIYANNYISNPDDLKPIGAAIKFITGYLIELSLSVDNIFVIAIIFSAFKIPQKYNTQSILGYTYLLGLMIFLASC
jgi:tellurite resistance protein TerC